MADYLIPHFLSDNQIKNDNEKIEVINVKIAILVDSYLYVLYRLASIWIVVATGAEDIIINAHAYTVVKWVYTAIK